MCPRHFIKNDRVIDSMKSKLLTLTFLSIFCLCVSATSTLSEFNGSRFPFGTTLVSATADTTKTFIVADSTSSTYADIEESWRQWRTVENHTFGKDRGNMPMIADLHSLHPYFRDRINQLIANCKKKGIELAIVESYRTHAKQSEYYTMGRKYTRSAGGKSKHQYGLAVDLVPMVKGIASWDDVVLWKKIGVEGEKLGLRWGGRWRSPYDPAHFEWSGGLTTYQLAAGALPTIPKSFTAEYPCLEDDVRELREHWAVWEELQLALRKSRTRNSYAGKSTP
jgi:hypothetical protein